MRASWRHRRGIESISDVPAFDRNKHYFIDFDGVYMNASVYLNGHLLGTRPYGFISYRYEMTPYLKAKDNVIAVRVDNSEQPNCRWYSGCGIYRHVYLVSSNTLHGSTLGYICHCNNRWKGICRDKKWIIISAS